MSAESWRERPGPQQAACGPFIAGETPMNGHIIVWVDPGSWPRQWRGADCGRAGAIAPLRHRAGACERASEPQKSLPLWTTAPGSPEDGRGTLLGPTRAVATAPEWPTSPLLASHCRGFDSRAVTHAEPAVRGQRRRCPHHFAKSWRALAEDASGPRATAATSRAPRRSIVRSTYSLRTFDAAASSS
jgi:hypothetical protein